MFGKKNATEILIVSGLPRSGTSMMMKMLDAGGIPPLTDHVRSADEDNPEGYYEFERVKKLREGDHAWLSEAKGKAVKVIATLLVNLPDNYNYRVIFMRRHMPEILASQRKMLVRRGKDPDAVSDAEIARLFEQHLRDVEEWMRLQPNVTYLDVSYNELVQDPANFIGQVNAFLGGRIDVQKAVQVIDPNLYRQRAD